MASLYQPGKCWSIQFEDRDGVRRSLSLGRVPKRTAQATKIRVEDLVAAHLAGTTPEPDTSRWLATAGDRLVNKLAAIGLAQNRSTALLGPWIDSFLHDREADNNFARRTYLSYLAPFEHLRQHLGDNKPLRSITKAEARGWRDAVAKLPGRNGEPLGENTVRKYVSKVRTLINAAIADELIDRNPFEGLPASTVEVRERQYFVTREEAAQVLGACPSLEWRLIFALCRFGGLRCPSELLVLRWGDVLWDRSRFVVDSPKTGLRVVPLFGELRPYLEQAFDQAEPGAEFVIGRTRDSSTNLRTTMMKIVRRAGLTPWPKLFQNLRATRATELADDFPSHVATAWLGHSEQIADKHYRQVTDDHFERASAAYMLQKAPEGGRSKPRRSQQTPSNAGSFNLVQLLAGASIAETGLEPVQEFPPGGF